jgi:hypothetical protein
MTKVRQVLTVLRASEYFLWGINCAITFFLGAGLLALGLRNYSPYASYAVTFYCLVILLVIFILSIRVRSLNQTETRIKALEMDHEFANVEALQKAMMDLTSLIENKLERING